LIGTAVVVISAHLVISALGNQPFAQPFSTFSAEGELVTAEGKIDRVTVTQSGGHLIIQVNNITVFVPANAGRGLTLQKGDAISVYGIVETYRGKKEIIVRSAKDIRIISQAKNNFSIR
jgi:DNA/RNA endonuclease YhcR with UshA esterase domain